LLLLLLLLLVLQLQLLLGKGGWLVVEGAVGLRRDVAKENVYAQGRRFLAAPLFLLFVH